MKSTSISWIIYDDNFSDHKLHLLSLKYDILIKHLNKDVLNSNFLNSKIETNEFIKMDDGQEQHSIKEIMSFILRKIAVKKKNKPRNCS